MTIDDVRHIAALARLEMDDERAGALMAELNTILSHVDVLSSVDTEGIEPVAGIGAQAAPLRADAGPPIPLARPIASLAPEMRDGLLLVPRLSTHEDPESG
ncbi:MAG: Asp-tRNA(Asn)/Glu-tRNA(Gln) amidotransferase subunit GatC [Gemmatimonadales bacterium]